ncbi:hypothetical protein B0T20DRAFT_344684 [Sordaria brevicollis]|uniref:Uncharacterized protein n=1 Tax=Sordaria brevicollis TaxID=83679 RepID=A0AAE0UFQ9_SORBR|nr:hypothetical protein B0T20DRAFT_344684 [Sordaria brevicollis]
MPSTASSRRNKRNRRGSTPPKCAPGNNGSKLAGRIMWLPHADELSSDTGFDEECHNHPVLVLSKKLSNDGKVDILMMTSFGGVDLEIKHRYSKAYLRSTFLPIDPSPPHPDNNILLKLDHGVTLRKNSYVKTEEKKRILFTLLRNYDRHGNKIYALTKASYETVVEHIGYQEPVEPVPVPVTKQPVVQPVVQPLPERISVPSYGYGTIPKPQPNPVSRPIQNTRSDSGYYSHNNYQYNSDAYTQRKRSPARPSGYSSSGSGSPDDLSKDAQVVLGLIVITTSACGVAFLYWLFKNLLGAIGGLKQVDWHKVAVSLKNFAWDVLVNGAKVIKYLVVAAAKGMWWVAKGAWGLVKDWVWGTQNGGFPGPVHVRPEPVWPVVYSEVLRRLGWTVPV